MIERLIPALWMGMAATSVLAVAAGAPAYAATLCAVDLNGNGDAADPGETMACDRTASGAASCPIGRIACSIDPDGSQICPAGRQYACSSVAGGPPSCSPNPCIDTGTTPILDEPPFADPGAPADGAIDTDGNCIANIEIFGGRAMRCRPSGARTSFQNCCKDKGRIVKDGMGSSLSSATTKVAVAKNVFTGMQAAWTAYKAGATAASAAQSGAQAIIVGLDPTSIAISLAVGFMMETLLQGCDAEDMEVGMLKGSDMCHEVGTYCSASVLGVCIQQARSFCCFNTKLGRILQEQGRPQLRSFASIGWGRPRAPACRGFTPEEFQALDFSRLDLSEYYSEIETRAQSQIQTDMKDRVDVYLQVMGH